MSDEEPKPTRRRIGARSADVVDITGVGIDDDLKPGLEFLRDLSGFFQADTLAIHARLLSAAKELGIVEILERHSPPTNQDLKGALDRIGEALETRPGLEDPKDESASYAWILVAVGIADAMLKDARSRDDLEATMTWATTIGRLTEWWTWRKQGLDRQALGKQTQETGLKQATAAKKAKAKSEPPLWWEQAVEDARKIKRQQPGLSAPAIAGILHRRGGLENKKGETPAAETIRRVISRHLR